MGGGFYMIITQSLFLGEPKFFTLPDELCNWALWNFGCIDVHNRYTPPWRLLKNRANETYL
jgi:hypothetical protein